jgi:signal transduction histidine kinase
MTSSTAPNPSADRVTVDRLDLPRVVSGRVSNEDLLDAVGFALSSRLDLADVLGLLADAARRATRATRCSILLLDGDVLQPTASVSGHEDGELFTAFLAMEPLQIRTVPQLSALLHGPAPMTVTDARAGGPIPREWVTRFGLVAVALVPLRTAEQPAGLMVLDHPSPAHFDPERMRVLSSLARYAGVAVRDARVHSDARRRADLMTRVAHAATSLAGIDEVGAMARLLADAAAGLVGATSATVALLDLAEQRARLVPSSDGATSTVPLSRLPAEVAGLFERRDVTVQVLHGQYPHLVRASGDGGGRTMVAPLVFEGRARGALLVALPPRVVVGTVETAAAATLASSGAAAIERAMLVRRLDEHLWRLQVISQAGTMLVDATTAEQLAAGIHDLLAGHGIEILNLTFRQRRLQQLLGGPRPEPGERQAIDRGTPVALPDGTTAVPLRSGRHVLGVVRLRTPQGDREDAEFLATLGRVVAELVARVALRLELDVAARDRQATTDRDRLSSELRESMTRLLAAIGTVARAPEGPSTATSWRRRLTRIAEVAETGASELVEAERAQAFLPSTGRGIVRAIRELGRSIATDAGIDVVVHAPDHLEDIPTDVAWALFRVAHRAMTFAWLQGRAAVIRIRVETTAPGVSLLLRDDGVALPHRTSADQALLAMRQVVATVDGTVHVHGARGHGVEVSVHVPAGGTP